MNNKGQSLAVFIIIIPVILVISAVLVDSLLIAYQKSHLISVTKMVIKDNIENGDLEMIKQDMRKNDINDDITINTSDGITIRFEHKINSFFGKLINKDKYTININIHGKTDGDGIKYEKGQKA